MLAHHINQSMLTYCIDRALLRSGLIFFLNPFFLIESVRTFSTVALS